MNVNAEHVSRIANEANDLRCPIADTPDLKNWSAAALADLKSLCMVEWDDASTTPLKREVFGRFVRLLPALGLLPPAHLPEQADFFYARLRVYVASAGYAAHKELTTALLSLDASAPFNPEADIGEWREELHAAHQMCGLPVTLLISSWSRVSNIIDNAGPEAARQMLKPLAAILLLTHARIANSDVRIIYRGIATHLAMESHKLDEAAMQRVRPIIGKALRIPKNSKESPPSVLAANSVLSLLTARNYLRCKPRPDLPPSVLWGTWSGLEPAEVNSANDFSDVGMRLSGVWEGMNGKVRVTRGSEHAVLSYAWKISPEEEDDTRDRVAFTKVVPDTYEILLPCEVLRKYFPNLDLSWASDPQAALAYYDAVLACSTVRHYRKNQMTSEAPMMWILPAGTTQASSTNNGKSVLTKVIARVVIPSLVPVSIGESTSAPDNRSILHHVRTHGTVCLDDWSPTTNKESILYKDTLQSQSTGTSHLGGEVLSNEGVQTHFREGPIFNVKCADLPPDMLNRCAFFWLHQLPAKDRANAEVANRLAAGEASIHIRLAIDHLVRELRLDTLPGIGVEDSRFPILTAVAVEFAKRRGVVDPLPSVLTAIRQMCKRMRAHYVECEDSGLAAMAEGRHDIHVRLGDVFHDLTMVQLEAISAYVPGPLTPSRLLRARLEAITGIPKGLRTALGEAGVIIPPGTKDKQIVNVFSEECFARMPQEGDTYTVLRTPIGSWVLMRRMGALFELLFDKEAR